jgi:hypothetical protein
MLILIDNYDCFTYNLFQYHREDVFKQGLSPQTAAGGTLRSSSEQMYKGRSPSKHTPPSPFMEREPEGEFIW